MSGVDKQVERIKALGLPGLDVRHIGVYVQPTVREVGDELVQTFAAYVGENEGNFSINFPTKLIFVIMTGGWEFERFELDGRTWDGIAIHRGSEMENGNVSHGCVVAPDPFMGQAFCYYRQGRQGHHHRWYIYRPWRFD